MQPREPARGTLGREGRPDPWRVLVVDDDPIVADVHCRLVSRVPGLRPVGVADSGGAALRAVARMSPDLMLLDLGLPGIDGMTLLKALRLRGYHGEVIVVTADRRADVVSASARFGTLDYLVKPFTPERLRQALTGFLHRMTALREPALEQEGIDRVWRASATGPGSGRWLPKGLSRPTLAEVRDVLAKSPSGLSAEEVAASVGMARVTVRRYLEYLVATGEALVDADIDGPGRPRKLYETREAA
jgi:two-component system response regulator DctR